MKEIKKQDQILSSRLIWVAIFLLALALRFLYLLEIKNTDAFTCPIGDGFVYKQWALDIAAGNWLGTDVKKQCNELAAMLLHHREIDAALACYTALLKLEPDNPVLNFNAGYAFFLKGDLPGAVTLYRKALQLKPDLKEAQVGLKMAQNKQKARPR